jgi:heterodisulfide reductase subunit C
MDLDDARRPGHTMTSRHTAAPMTPHADARGFTAEVVRRSGVNVHMCWHCSCCSGGCPFSEAMGLLPHQVLRLVQLGQKREALENSMIWICVGCHTCSMQCPNLIDIPAVCDVLRQMSLQQGYAVAEPEVLGFHREVLDSIRRYGRTHKLEIMLRFKLRTRDWLNDLPLGLKMLARGKLELLPTRIGGIDQVRQLFRRRNTL